MKKTTANLAINSFDCFVHKMQLAISNGIELISDELKQVKSVVELYNRSTAFQKEFRSAQTVMNMKELGLTQDVTTRWNSTLHMLERVLENKMPLLIALGDYRKNNPKSIHRLSDDALSFSTPTVFRYLLLATVLDPRYKLICLPEESRFMAKTMLKFEMQNERYIEGERGDSLHFEPVPKKKRSDDILANFLIANADSDEQEESVSNSQAAAFKLELDAYFKESIIEKKKDPMDYWRLNVQYKLLKSLARKFLTPPPTSVESERVFSTMGGICTPKRSNLSADHGKELLFLHHHY